MARGMMPLRLHDDLPEMLSERAVEQHLRDVLPRRTPDTVIREAVLVAWIVSLPLGNELGRGGGERLSERQIAFDAGTLAGLLGLTPATVEEANKRLCRAGVWREVTGRSGERWVCFEPDVLERSSAIDELAWSRLVPVLAGDAGALALVSAYLNLMRPPYDGWHAIAHADAGRRMHAGRDAVRRARGVLIDRGIVEERPVPGQSTEIRWTAFARGDGPSNAAQSQMASAPAVTSAPETAFAPPPPTGGATGRVRLPAGVPLQLGTLPLEVPPGVTPELEVDAAGRFYLWLGPIRLGPIDG